MRMTVRPLAAWPYEPLPVRQAQFSATYSDTLLLLEAEIDALRGSEVVLGLVVAERDVRLDGQLRAEARPSYPGVELSFDTPRGRLAFHTDRHRGYQTRQAWVSAKQRGSDEGAYRAVAAWHDNLRALALGLEALRAVDRYGVTATGQQYAGFLAIPADTAVSRGRALVERHGGVIEALKMTHPDHGGDASDFHAVQAYRATGATKGGL